MWTLVSTWGQTSRRLRSWRNREEAVSAPSGLVPAVTVMMCRSQDAGRVLGLYDDTRRVVVLAMGAAGSITRCGHSPKTHKIPVQANVLFCRLYPLAVWLGHFSGHRLLLWPRPLKHPRRLGSSQRRRCRKHLGPCFEASQFSGNGSASSWAQSCSASSHIGLLRRRGIAKVLLRCRSGSQAQLLFDCGHPPSDYYKGKLCRA